MGMVHQYCHPVTFLCWTWINNSDHLFLTAAFGLLPNYSSRFSASWKRPAARKTGGNSCLSCIQVKVKSIRKESWMLEDFFVTSRESRSMLADYIYVVCSGDWNEKSTYSRWMFPKIGVPQNGWFMMENPIKMDDLGVPLFLETPRCWFQLETPNPKGGSPDFWIMNSMSACPMWFWHCSLLQYKSKKFKLLLGFNKNLGKQGKSMKGYPYKMGPYDRYKWSYNPYKWPYTWVTGTYFGVISPHLFTHLKHQIPTNPWSRWASRESSGEFWCPWPHPRAQSEVSGVRSNNQRRHDAKKPAGKSLRQNPLSF